MSFPTCVEWLLLSPVQAAGHKTHGQGHLWGLLSGETENQVMILSGVALVSFWWSQAPVRAGNHHPQPWGPGKKPFWVPFSHLLVTCGHPHVMSM